MIYRTLIILLLAVVTIMPGISCSWMDDVPILTWFVEDDDEEERKEFHDLLVLIAILSNNGHNGNLTVQSLEVKTKISSLSNPNRAIFCSLLQTQDPSQFKEYCLNP
ncbi:hypothetical protein [Leptospira andrefontaineae]|uniref:Uncharacterized protein n=1 Tax=Leptospira andrefontaineae TaxID=2484976 RepID=A0A4R9HAQ3_9LEPT|nr:hypothetical protein [Leptospira andrefontaineae]TGK43452.1 hypothetical protein EHO65_02065 [Leptospira andrefontaineae]